MSKSSRKKQRERAERRAHETGEPYRSHSEQRAYLDKLDGFAQLAMEGVTWVMRGGLSKEDFLNDMGEACRQVHGRVLVTLFPASAVTSAIGREAVVGMLRTDKGEVVDVDVCMGEEPYTCTWLESPNPPRWLTDDSAEVFPLQTERS
jgi:hypothetical protein